MNINNGLALIAPQVTPVLDPWFRPAVLANRAFRELVRAAPGAIPVRIALEQNSSSVSHYQTQILPENHPQASGNFIFIERILRFLIWSRGGWRIYFDGPASLAAKLGAYYKQTP